MSRDVELSRGRLLEAQTALLSYSHRPDHASNQKELIEELHQATKAFVDSVERLAQNPPTRLVPD